MELDGKPKWLPLNFGYHDGMRSAPIDHEKKWKGKATDRTDSVFQVSIGDARHREVYEKGGRRGIREVHERDELL